MAWGEWATTTMGIGKGSSLEIVQELRFPHSIGLLYSVFTAFLGFEVNDGEYKVMGMAPFGSPRYAEDVWKVVEQDTDGAFRLDLPYFSFHYNTKRAYTRKFMALFGEPRDPEVPFFTKTSGFPDYFGERPANFREMCDYNQHYADIAASVQYVVEELLLTLAQELHRRTGLTKLCLAGGVALNSVANGRILRETPFEEIYIQPAAGDGGGSVGCALMGWHGALGHPRKFVMDHAYWGQAYSDDDIQAALDRYGAKSVRIEDEDKLVEQTVARMSSGKVVGWHQGRFEWGPRALGNRSIIADPRHAKMKDIVNTKIKFREPFRPFAPSVLAEAAESYFEFPDAMKSLPARFMLLVVPVNGDKQEEIPAVSQMGTAHIQTVHETTSPLYYRLIKGFGDATGVPVVLNTSFNVRGEPIVTTPDNALHTFSNSDIDTLVMGNYLVDKV